MCFKLPKIKSHKYLSMRCASKYLDILFYWNYLVHWLYMIIYYSFHRSNFSTTTLCRTGRLYVLGEFLVGYLIVYKLVKEFGMAFIFIKLIQSQMTKNTVLRILKVSRNRQSSKRRPRYQEIDNRIYDDSDIKKQTIE